MRRWIIGLLAAIALIVAYWWMSARPALQPITAPSKPAAPPAASAEPERSLMHQRPWPSATAAPEDARSAAGVLEGRVMSSATGLGIAGAELVFAAGNSATTIVAGEGGAFVFAPRAPGDYTLAEARAEGHFAFEPAWGRSPIVFHAREGVRVSGALVVLDPVQTITVLVLDAEKKPRSGARVEVFAPEGAETTSTHETDGRGEAVIAAADEAIVEARHPQAGSGRARIDLAAQIARRLEIVLAPGADEARAAIAGVVSDEAAQPIAEARVLAYRTDQDDAPILAASTGEDGRFRFDVRAGGVYAVTAAIEERARATVEEVKPPREDLVLKLDRGGVIRGTVTAAEDGRPVAAFAVWIGKEEGPLRIEEYATRLIYDARGELAIGGIEPGSYTVSVIAEGFAPGRKTGLGENARADFELSRGARIRGVVRDAKTRSGLAGAKVALEGPFGAGDSVLRSFMEARTDRAGRFELGGLGVGPHAVFAVAEGHHARIASGVMIDSPEAIAEIELELTPLRENEKAGMELAGIGAVLEPTDAYLKVKGTLPGGGAAEVGLVPGDLIESIDGVSVVDLGFGGAIQRIRGPEGSFVRLGLMRADGARVVIEVPRRVVRT